MEKDDNIKGAGNSYDFGARMYDSRLGRWLSCDAHAGSYQSISPYVFSLNSPLIFKDVDGNDAIITIQKDPNGPGKIITISTIAYIKGNPMSGFSKEGFIDSYNDFAAQHLNKSVKLKDGNTIKFDIQFESYESKPGLDIKSANEVGNNVVEVIENFPGGLAPMNHKREESFEGELLLNEYQLNTEAKANPLSRIVTHELLHLMGLVDRLHQGETTQGFKGTLMDDAKGSDLSPITYES